MDILVVGGTRFFGIPMVQQMLQDGHQVTIATRGTHTDPFSDTVERINVDVLNEESVIAMLNNHHYDIIVDKIAYCSNDIKMILDHVTCDRFIHMSTTAVYRPLHDNTVEEDFVATRYPLQWCERTIASYDEVKRQAESALMQQYKEIPSVAVRYPYVIGANDYTKRLQFYVEHVIQGIPMYVDNPDSRLAFISEEEAGRFLAYLVNQTFTGPINGCLQGAMTLREIISYIEQKTQKKAIYRKNGDQAPYNGTPSHWINTKKAEAIGYRFGKLNPYVKKLLDTYIRCEMTHASIGGERVLNAGTDTAISEVE